MSDQKPVYLVSTAYGGVVTQQADGYPSGVVMERRGIKDDEQKWILEFGEEPDTVALKNVANDKYMSASGENYKPVGTGEKTWWKMWYSDVSTPGAFRLSVASGPDENCIEIQTDQNKKDKVILFTWRQDHGERRRAFYFVDCDGGDYSAASRSASKANHASAAQEEDIAAKQKALEEREAALVQRENENSDRQKAFEEREAAGKKSSDDREAALAKKASDNSAKEKALENREASLDQRDRDSANKKKDFDDREAAFKQKEKDHITNRKAFDDREAAWTKQQGDSAANKKDLDDRKAALAQQEKVLKNREIALEQYEKDSAAGKKIFERRKTALAQREKDFVADKKALDDREATMTEKENKRAAEWDKKMKELQGLREAAAQLKKSDTGNQVGCGSKHYKPPRKLNRKIIGLVYE